MTPHLRVLPPQWLIAWGTDVLHHHPWDDLTRESWQQRQDPLDPARGTEGHRCSRKAPGLCCALPSLQPLLAGPAALAVPPNPPCPKHRTARRGFAKRGRTTEKQWPKFKHVHLQEWPDPGRAPDTEALSCHRPHMCKGKGTHSRTHAVPIAHSMSHAGPLPTPISQLLEISLKKGQVLLSPIPSLRGVQPQLRPGQGLARSAQAQMASAQHKAVDLPSCPTAHKPALSLQGEGGSE